MAPPAPEPARALRADARFGARFLRRHGWRLLLLFIGVLLPLWGFAALADEVREAQPFAFDGPILRFAQDSARAGFDRVFLFFSAIGYGYGVVPADVLLVALLALRQRLREGLFAGVAVLGSALLNIACKGFFARERPGLWPSIAPESSYSFPSGHAMGSMTLALVLIGLAWPTPWRWPVLAAMTVLVTMVGLSRVYLGVHYPSDILAGWAAAAAWTVAVFVLVFRGQQAPWRDCG